MGFYTILATYELIFLVAHLSQAQTQGVCLSIEEFITRIV